MNNSRTQNPQGTPQVGATLEIRINANDLDKHLGFLCGNEAIIRGSRWTKPNPLKPISGAASSWHMDVIKDSLKHHFNGPAQQPPKTRCSWGPGHGHGHRYRYRYTPMPGTHLFNCSATLRPPKQHSNSEPVFFF